MSVVLCRYIQNSKSMKSMGLPAKLSSQIIKAWFNSQYDSACFDRVPDASGMTIQLYLTGARDRFLR